MPTESNPLEQQISPVPAWLTAPPDSLHFSRQVVDSFLESRVVYYPGSGEDWAPMQLFARAAHCYLYADYQKDLAAPPSIPGCAVIHSQEVTAEEVLQGLGISETGVPPIEFLTQQELEQIAVFVPGPRVASGRWTILEQQVTIEGVPVRKRIALLQVKAEAVWLYRAIWGLRNPRPNLFALYTAHDGPNWTNWTVEGKMFWVAVNHNAFPTWYRCFNGREWPEYDEQFRDAEGEAVFRRTDDLNRLRPMELFQRVRDPLSDVLAAGDSAALKESPFWGLRYRNFVDDNPGIEEMDPFDTGICGLMGIYDKVRWR